MLIPRTVCERCLWLIFLVELGGGGAKFTVSVRLLSSGTITHAHSRLLSCLQMVILVSWMLWYYTVIDKLLVAMELTMYQEIFHLVYGTCDRPNVSDSHTELSLSLHITCPLQIVAILISVLTEAEWIPWLEPGNRSSTQPLSWPIGVAVIIPVLLLM